MSLIKNYSRLVFVVDDRVQGIRVSYEKNGEYSKHGKTYLFKYLPPEDADGNPVPNSDLKVGDFVVVPTNTRHGMTVCRVEEINVEVDVDGDVEMKWVIGKVDWLQSERVKEWEKRIISVTMKSQKQKQREALKSDIEAAIGGTLPQIALSSVVLEESDGPTKDSVTANVTSDLTPEKGDDYRE